MQGVGVARKSLAIIVPLWLRTRAAGGCARRGVAIRVAMLSNFRLPEAGSTSVSCIVTLDRLGLNHYACITFLHVMALIRHYPRHIARV